MKKFIILFAFFINISLHAVEDQFNLKKINATENIQLMAAGDYLTELCEESLALRGTLLQFITLYEANENQTLTGKQIEELIENFKHQLLLRKKMYNFIDTYKNRCLENQNLIYGEPQIVKGGMLSITAAAVLYDNFAICWTLVNSKSKLRRLFNNGDSGVQLAEDEFEEIVKSFHSPSNRQNMQRALTWFKKNKDLVTTLSQSDKQIEFMNQIISQSPCIKDLEDGYEFGAYIKFLGFIGKESRHSVSSLGENSVSSISKVFGNTVGLVQTRNGLLLKDFPVHKTIRQTMKPFDILLEKTPFRLTDKFIPGHFGHVAIYIGSKEELVQIGLWDSPAIKPWQEQISAGKCVLEALRDGVQLSTFEKFMNVDDIAVLRVKNFDITKVAPRAFGQLGKEYDFNFDVQTIDKIVCSELVYQVFTDIQWDTQKNLGRYTISPDHVAKKVDSDLIQLITLYHKGQTSDLTTYKKLIDLK